MIITRFLPTRLCGLPSNIGQFIGKLGTKLIRYYYPDTSEALLPISHVELPPELIQKIFNEMATGAKINFKNTCKTLNNASKLSLSQLDKDILDKAKFSERIRSRHFFNKHSIAANSFLAEHGLCNPDQAKEDFDAMHVAVLSPDYPTSKKKSYMNILGKAYSDLGLEYYRQYHILKAEACLGKACVLGYSDLELGNSLFKYYFEKKESEQCLRIEKYLNEIGSSERFTLLVQEAFDLIHSDLTQKILKVYQKRGECYTQFRLWKGSDAQIKPFD